MKKNGTIFNGLLAAAIGLLLLGGCGTNDNDTSYQSKGKLAQSAVSGATVFWDLDGDKTLDSNEPSTTSGSDGSFTLNVPDDAEGIIVTTGGTLIDTGRAALPMFAPRDASFVTPLTTLVAINPDVKAVLGKYWDADISSASGVDGKLLQLALAVESFQSSLVSMNTDINSQYTALTLLSGYITQKNLVIDSEVKAAFTETIAAMAAGGSVLPPTVQSSVDAIIDSIDESASALVESSVKPGVDQYIYSGPAIVYLPSTDLAKVSLPLPNDIVWSGLEGKIPTSDLTDPSAIALYTAVNKLGNAGLSPNTPISIPLTDSITLNPTALSASVVVMNLTAYLSGSQDYIETDISVKQEGNFIKVYPIEPLAAGNKYLVVVLDNILLKDSATEKVKKNPLFEILKSTTPLYSDESTASDSLKSLELIRQSYNVAIPPAPASLFDALASQGMTRDKILTIFTFSTASKTLSLTDYGVIAATVAAGGSPDDMTITGFDYSTVNGEYAAVNTAVPTAAALSAVDSSAKTFTSLDITTLTAAQPSPVSVPYYVANGSTYTDTVVIFQHGFTGYKEQSAALAAKYTKHPVIAMDLPAHGARDASPTDPTDSGSKYLTANMGQNRVNLYQSYFDISVLIQDLAAGKFDLNDDGTLDTPSNIYFTGISLGSITGSVAASNNIATLDKVVLNVGGANFAAIFDQAKSALLTAIFTELGLTKDTAQYFISLGVVQLLMDPADPVYNVSSAMGTKTMFQAAYHDTVVPNVANQILSNAVGATTSVSVTDMASDLTAYAPYTGTKFIFGGDSAMTKNWVTHGFLLSPAITDDSGNAKYPEAAGYLDADYVSNAHDAVITLTSDFFDN